jgi:hypothetical protein
MAESTTIDSNARRAPHRDRFSLITQVAILFAPPLGWSAHLIINYALAAHSCYPDGSPLPYPTLSWLAPALIVVDIISLLTSATCAWLSYRSWRAIRGEMGVTHPATMEAAEERTHFLAGWGMIISIGFFVLVASDMLSIFIVPICS